MDLLITPADPALPIDDVPYLAGDERWDCGPFLTYADRCQLDSIEEEVTLLDHVQKLGDLQTWLFFGLMAEFLGLNEQEHGNHIIDQNRAQSELDALYEGSILVKENGLRYITGAKVLAMVPLMQERLTKASPVGYIESRQVYLNNCFNLALNRIAKLGKSIDYVTKCLVNALVETISIAWELSIRELADLESRPAAMPLLPWLDASEYVGRLEKQMLAHGWCISELERIVTYPYGMNTTHYICQLKKSGPRKNHSQCNKDMCSAFQISKDEYEPAHVEESCVCDFLGVDIGGVLDILRKTKSYPVLTGKVAWNEDSGSDEAQVEAREPDMPYVAISHVWADGLGHPTANALPRCQIEHLTSLTANLQDNVDPDWEERGHSPYRVWVDTLCCPVGQHEDKSIALERLADVYKNATHVLVLDTSLTCLSSKSTEPAELLCRALSCSAWMRRLWTLQEGALARSLVFQFADGAITIDALLDKMYKTRAKDARMFRLWLDLRRLGDAFKQFGAPVNTMDSHLKPSNALMNVQDALNYRTVSVPSDEPLCIATLLGLDNERIANENCEDVTEKRMAILWEMIAERYGIPLCLPLMVDNPLNVEGFRWAPRSLLADDVQQPTANGVGVYYREGEERTTPGRRLPLILRSSRFRFDPDQKTAQLILQSDRKGLRGSFSGARLYTRPYPGLDTAPAHSILHPWHGALEEPCDGLLHVKDEETGWWFQIRRPVGEEIGIGLSPVVHTGRCALIRNANRTPHALMVLVEHENEMEIAVRRQFDVTLTKLSEENAVVAETMTLLAAELAAEQVTAEYIAVQDRTGSEEYTFVQEKLKKRMQELYDEALKVDHAFADAIETLYGGAFISFGLWEMLWMLYPHHNSLKEVPDGQVWLID